MFSLRQACLTHGIRPNRDILGPTQRFELVQIGNSQCWIDVTHTPHQSVRTLRPSGERASAGANYVGEEIVRMFAEGLFRPFSRLLMVARQEVTESRPGLRCNDQGVQWTHPHRLGKMFDSGVVFAQEDAGPAAEHPCCSQVWTKA